MARSTTPATTSRTTALPRSPGRRRSRLRALVVALLFGLLAPLVSVAGTAEAAGYHARTTHELLVGRAVLTLINKERKAHGLKKVSMSQKLKVSARAHDTTMARQNAMAHKLPGEKDFTRRISKTGYKWTWAGENIAWNSSMTVSGVKTLQKVMYNERAPYNGHRQNILNKHFKNVGIDVYMDYVHHKVWLTTDFGRL